MRDPNDKGEFSPELNAMLEDAVRQMSRPLAAHELRKHPEPDTRTRQQRRHEKRKGIRQPDQDAAAQAKADADRRADRKRRSGVTAASIDRYNPQAWGGKLNIYICEHCRAHIVTRDLGEGVTPFMLSSGTYCPNRCAEDTPGGRIMMTSSMYRVYDQSMREDYQWYAPDAAERSQASAYQRDHYNKGGLEIRKAVFDGEA